jgi:hypothetical protein
MHSLDLTVFPDGKEIARYTVAPGRFGAVIGTAVTNGHGIGIERWGSMPRKVGTEEMKEAVD